ncbi:MAG: radical SAM protein [Bacteroidales bacterium]|nr:radical SAM protein [Bacteroidales bacterium]
MSIAKLSLKKKLGLKLYQQYKANETKIHRLSYLLWECTLRCNLSCKHCGSDCHRDMKQQDMPLSDFLKVIDSITPHVNTHNTMIVITGGEPLMRKDLEECGRELYKREYPWGMVSNGLAMTEKRLNSLIASGLRSVTISLDGLEDAHNKLRGNPNSFKNAFNAVKLLTTKEEHLIFDVVTCVSPINVDQLPSIRQMLIDAGVKRWRIFTIFPIGRATINEELQLSPRQFKSVFDFIRETKKEGKIALNYGCEGYLGNYEGDVRDNFFFCRAGINIASVLVDGSISACPNLRANFIQGNIYKDDFMTVWNNNYKLFRNREWMKQGICADCKEWKYCQGNGMHLRDEDGNLLFCHLKRLQEA